MRNRPVAEEVSPAERRRLRVRASILEAAEKVFAESGEEGLSIRRLADEIDYSPAAIYKYFGSKDELLDELKEAFFGRILDQVDEVMEADRPYLDRARNCVATYIHTALEKPHHYTAAFSGTKDPGEPIASSWREFSASNKGQAFLHLVDLVREGQELGDLSREVDPIMAAKSVWASCHGLAMLMAHLPNFPSLVDEQDAPDRDSFLQLHARHVIRGLQVPEHSGKTTRGDQEDE